MLTNKDGIFMARFPDFNRFKWLVSYYVVIIYIIWAYFLVGSHATAGQVSLEWDTSNDNNILGYMVYWRTNSTNGGNYSESVDVGYQYTYTLSGLTEGDIYYFCVTAYNDYTESDFSNEVSAIIPISNNAPGSGVENNKLLSDYEVAYPKVAIEAESFYINSPMISAKDSKASGGQYICVPGGRGNGGYAEYLFNIPKSGNYVVWGRTLAIDGGSNSFYVSLDDEYDWTWHIQTSSEWIWNAPRSYYLEAGQHRITIRQREKRTKLDKILFSSDPDYIPAN